MIKRCLVACVCGAGGSGRGSGIDRLRCHPQERCPDPGQGADANRRPDGHHHAHQTVPSRASRWLRWISSRPNGTTRGGSARACRSRAWPERRRCRQRRRTCGSDRWCRCGGWRPRPPQGPKPTPTPTPTPRITLQEEPYPDEKITNAVSKVFEDEKLYLYRTSVGTRPDRLFVQIVTDSEREVFDAVQTVCKAFHLIAGLGADVAPGHLPVRCFDVFEASSTRGRCICPPCCSLGAG